MQVHRGCAIPEEYLYNLEFNNWVRLEDGGTALVGMTDIAQTLCGKIVSISWKRAGRAVARGRSLAVIESAKWVGPFLAPLTCEVVESNAESFEQDGLIANRDPYGAGWLMRVRPTALEEERHGLVDGVAALEHFRALIDSEGITCMRCAD